MPEIVPVITDIIAQQPDIWATDKNIVSRETFDFKIGISKKDEIVFSAINAKVYTYRALKGDEYIYWKSNEEMPSGIDIKSIVIVR